MNPYEAEIWNSKMDALWEALHKVIAKLDKLERRLEELEERVAILENTNLIEDNEP